MNPAVPSSVNEPDIYLPLNVRSLSFRWRGTTYDFSIEDRFLTIVSSQYPFRTTTKTPLGNLLEEFVVDTPPPSVQFHISRFLYGLAAALVVQFSVLPRFVPGLAFVLFGFALVHLVKFLRNVMPVQQTRVFDYYGGVAAVIPHLPEIEASRSRFEDQLYGAITRARALSLRI
jgi:hypothetical protein